MYKALFILLIPTLSFGADFYFNPGDPEPSWQLMKEGDVLYICGVHEPSRMLVPTVNGITIDGACPNNPGTLFHAGFKLTNFGLPNVLTLSYAIRLGGNTSVQVIEDMKVRLKKATGPPDLTWEAGSFYHDTVNKVLYYRPSGLLPKPLYTSDGHSAIKLENVSGITIRNLKIRNTATGNGSIKLHNAPYSRIENVDIRWASTKAIYGHNSSNSVITKNKIRDVANGIYFVDTKNSASDNLTITHNDISNVDQDNYYNHDDAHCIGMQGGSHNFIGYNLLTKCGGSGITMFAFNGQKQTNNVIHANIVDDIRTLVSRPIERGRVKRGIETGGININSPNNVHNNVISNNVITNVERECIRTKSTKSMHGVGWAIVNNETSKCGVSFAWSEGAAGDPAFILKNNKFSGAKHFQQQHYNKKDDRSGIEIANNIWLCE